jgi:type I restriction enzyme R subunit
LQVYSQYNEQQIYSLLKINNDILQDYSGKYHNILEEIRRRINIEPDKPIDIDLDYVLESIHKDEIDYKYIMSLIQSLIPDGYENRLFNMISSKDEKLIDEYIKTLANRNPKLAQMIDSLWNDIKSNPDNFREQTVDNLLDQMINDVVEKEVVGIAKKWGIDDLNALEYYVRNYNNSLSNEKQEGKDPLIKRYDYESYKNATLEIGFEPLNKFKFKSAFLEELNTIILKDILPLTQR